MRQLVESMKRLYFSGKVGELKINEMCEKGTITKEEKEYILRKEE